MTQDLDPTKSGGGGDPENVTLSRAELERLKASDAKQAKLVQEANSLGFTDPDEYLVFLQEEKLEKLGAGGDPNKADPNKADPNKADPNKAPVVDNRLVGQIAQAQNVATQGLLGMQFFEYKDMVREADPQAKLPYTKQELETVIRTRTASVAEIAKEQTHGGNMFSAAAFLLSLPQTKAKAAAEGAAAATAAERAAASASIGPSGVIPAKGGTKPDAATELRNRIAPKVGVYEG